MTENITTRDKITRTVFAATLGTALVSGAFAYKDRTAGMENLALAVSHTNGDTVSTVDEAVEKYLDHSIFFKVNNVAIGEAGQLDYQAYEAHASTANTESVVALGAGILAAVAGYAMAGRREQQIVMPPADPNQAS